MLLQIKNLKINYKSDNRLLEVVRGVDMDIDKGECVGLIGESGCGKTTVGLSITKLIPERKGNISSGKILFEGKDILKLNPEELRDIRGSRISYVFQEPFSSLNPVFTIYEQIKESLEEQILKKAEVCCDIRRHYRTKIEKQNVCKGCPLYEAGCEESKK